MKSTALLLLLTFAAAELSYAAPQEGVKASLSLRPLEALMADPAAFEVPLDHSSLKETHKSAKNTLIIHIQDPHSNYSGQLNLAAMLDDIMEKYGVSLVMVEGGFGDGTLTGVRRLIPQEECRRMAKSLLLEGQISGEEYLNLTSERPMKIVGVENVDLYAASLLAYSKLAGQREEILAYLNRISASIDKLKKKLYPEDLLAYEAKTRESENAASSNIDGLLDLAGKAGVELKDFPSVRRLAALHENEKKIDFTAAALEQAALLQKLDERGYGGEVRERLERIGQAKGSKVSQYSLFQNILNIAQEKNVSLGDHPNLVLYGRYLKEFTELDIDGVLAETSRVEDAIYRRLLSADEDAKLLKAVDRYVGLLKTAYSIKMTTDEFRLFIANEQDFSTPAYLAFINRRLTRYGWFSQLLPYQNKLEEGRKALIGFYDSVGRRDGAFIENAEMLLAREQPRAAVLITGGYHTQNLKQLFKKRGWSYAVLAPIVTAETNQQKYEEQLFTPIRKKATRIEVVRDRSLKDRSLAELRGTLKPPSENDGIRRVFAFGGTIAKLVGGNSGPQASALLRRDRRNANRLRRALAVSGTKAEGARLAGTSGERSERGASADTPLLYFAGPRTDLGGEVLIRDSQPDFFESLSVFDFSVVREILSGDIGNKPELLERLIERMGGRVYVKAEEVDIYASEGRSVYFVLDNESASKLGVREIRMKGVRPKTDGGEALAYGGVGYVDRPYRVLKGGGIGVGQQDMGPLGGMKEERAALEYQIMKESEGASGYLTDKALAWGVYRAKSANGKPLAFFIAGVKETDERISFRPMILGGTIVATPTRNFVDGRRKTALDEIQAETAYRAIGRSLAAYHQKYFHRYPHAGNFGLKINKDGTIEVYIRDLDTTIRRDSIEASNDAERKRIEAGYRFIDIMRVIYDLKNPRQREGVKGDFLIRPFLEEYFIGVSDRAIVERAIAAALDDRASQRYLAITQNASDEIALDEGDALFGPIWKALMADGARLADFLVGSENRYRGGTLSIIRRQSEPALPSAVRQERSLALPADDDVLALIPDLAGMKLAVLVESGSSPAVLSLVFLLDNEDLRTRLATGEISDGDPEFRKNFVMRLALERSSLSSGTVQLKIGNPRFLSSELKRNFFKQGIFPFLENRAFERIEVLILTEPEDWYRRAVNFFTSQDAGLGFQLSPANRALATRALRDPSKTDPTPVSPQQRAVFNLIYTLTIHPAIEELKKDGEFAELFTDSLVAFGESGGAAQEYTQFLKATGRYGALSEIYGRLREGLAGRYEDIGVSPDLESFLDLFQAGSLARQDGSRLAVDRASALRLLEEAEVLARAETDENRKTLNELLNTLYRISEDPRGPEEVRAALTSPESRGRLEALDKSLDAWRLEGYSLKTRPSTQAIAGGYELEADLFKDGVPVSGTDRPMQIKFSVMPGEKMIYISLFYPEFPAPGASDYKHGRGRALLRRILSDPQFRDHEVIAYSDSRSFQLSFGRMYELDPVTPLNAPSDTFPMSVLRTRRIAEIEANPRGVSAEEIKAAVTYWNLTSLHGRIPGRPDQASGAELGPSEGARLSTAELVQAIVPRYNVQADPELIQDLKELYAIVENGYFFDADVAKTLAGHPKFEYVGRGEYAAVFKIKKPRYEGLVFKQSGDFQSFAYETGAIGTEFGRQAAAGNYREREFGGIRMGWIAREKDGVEDPLTVPTAYFSITQENKRYAKDRPDHYELTGYAVALEVETKGITEEHVVEARTKAAEMGIDWQDGNVQNAARWEKSTVILDNVFYPFRQYLEDIELRERIEQRRLDEEDEEARQKEAARSQSGKALRVLEDIRSRLNAAGEDPKALLSTLDLISESLQYGANSVIRPQAAEIAAEIEERLRVPAVARQVTAEFNVTSSKNPRDTEKFTVRRKYISNQLNSARIDVYLDHMWFSPEMGYDYSGAVVTYDVETQAVVIGGVSFENDPVLYGKGFFTPLLARALEGVDLVFLQIGNKQTKDAITLAQDEARVIDHDFLSTQTVLGRSLKGFRLYYTEAGGKAYLYGVRGSAGHAERVLTLFGRQGLGTSGALKDAVYANEKEFASSAQASGAPAASVSGARAASAEKTALPAQDAASGELSILRSAGRSSGDLKRPLLTTEALADLSAEDRALLAALAQHLSRERDGSAVWPYELGTPEGALYETMVQGSIASTPDGGKILSLSVRGTDGTDQVYSYPVAASELSGASVLVPGLPAPALSVSEDDLFLRSTLTMENVSLAQAARQFALVLAGNPAWTLDTQEKLALAIVVNDANRSVAEAMKEKLQAALDAYRPGRIFVVLASIGDQTLSFAEEIPEGSKVLVFADGTDAANRAAVAKAGKDYGLVSAPPIELSKRDSRFSSANYAAAGLFRSMFSGVKPADVNDIVAAQKDLVDQMFSTLFKRSIPFDVQLRFIRASIQYEPAADPGDDAAFFKQTMLPRLLKLTQNVLSAATEAMMRAVGAAA